MLLRAKWGVGGGGEHCGHNSSRGWKPMEYGHQGRGDGVARGNVGSKGAARREAWQCCGPAVVGTYPSRVRSELLALARWEVSHL